MTSTEPVPAEPSAAGEEPASYHVWVDESTCIGSGSCVRLATGAFVMDDDRGVAVVGDVSAVEERRLIAAERVCPTGAIHLERLERSSL